MVAPNGARRKKHDHPAIPVTIAETVESARQCFEAGAGGLHAHVRDQRGEHVLDAGLYRELLEEMRRAVPKMMVQITTEAVGRYSAQQQRQLVQTVQPAAVSVGMGEMMSDGDEGAARRFYHEAEEHGIAVQHILYEAAELETLFDLTGRGIVPSGPLQLLFVLGRYTKNQQSDPAMLKPFLDALERSEQTHDWAICAFGVAETRCLEAALKNGGKARVGFENGLHNADGTLAADNAERVREIHAIAHRLSA